MEARRPAVDSARMGWRDRDWAKFDDEWSRLVDARASPYRTVTGKNAAPVLVQSRPRKDSLAGTVLIVAVLLSAAAMLGIDAFRHSLTKPLTLPPLTRPAPANVISIRWSPGDLLPAASAGDICVNDARHGRICAAYAIGEKPADALARQLNALGLSVRSSG